MERAEDQPGLRFRPEEASALERWDGASELQHHAVSLVRRLVAVLGRTCFVITPFKDEFLPLYESVIAPTVEQIGDRPVRLDILAVPGDACRQIQEGIAAADYVIAVLDELRPNVLYELGLAHGHGKPTILVGRNGADGVIDLPFDPSTQQCATYDAPDASACARLAAAIQGLAHRLGR